MLHLTKHNNQLPLPFYNVKLRVKIHIKIYHPVNRLRSFLLLGHSVTRSLGHLVTIFNMLTD